MSEITDALQEYLPEEGMDIGFLGVALKTMTKKELYAVCCYFQVEKEKAAAIADKLNKQRIDLMFKDVTG